MHLKFREIKIIAEKTQLFKVGSRTFCIFNKFVRIIFVKGKKINQN